MPCVSSVNPADKIEVSNPLNTISTPVALVSAVSVIGDMLRILPVPRYVSPLITKS